MTKGRTIALAAGFVGALALGVAIGPTLTSRFAQKARPAAVESTQPSAAAESQPAAAPKAVSRPKAPAASATKRSTPPKNEAAAVHIPASQPELQARLKPVLNRGANMSMAADGFRDAEEFATVAHAARDTQVPFMVLKYRVLNEKKTLAEALKASKPELDVDSAVARARGEAKADIAAISS